MPDGFDYFDHNATMPMTREARQLWLEAAETHIGNPSSPHRLGARAEAALDEARHRLAAHLQCDASDLVWTSGATESNNQVLHAIARAASNPESAEVWLSAVEHPCALSAAANYLPGRTRWIPVSSDGVADVGWLDHAEKRARPSLVGVMAANNETGVLQPWQTIRDWCRARGIPFFCDAAQWVGKLPAAGLGQCDFVTGCAHKFGGPPGVGFLKCPSKGGIVPLLTGGGQEQGRRAGTENVPGVLAMVGVLDQRERDIVIGGIEERLPWRANFERSLMNCLPSTDIVGGDSERLWNTVSAIMPATDCRLRWVVKLDRAGFAVSTGSACASGREKPSHVLSAMGIPGSVADRALRFSAGWDTTEEAWIRLADQLTAIYQRHTSHPDRSAA